MQSRPSKPPGQRVAIAVLVVIAMLFGAALLGWAQAGWKQRQSRYSLDRILNQEGPITPRWLSELRPCSPPDARQAAQDKAMASLANLFADERDSAGLYYVVQWFGWHWRIDGKTDFNKPDRCPPASYLYGQVAPILERADWLRSAQDRFNLELIERLPASRYIAKRLGETAFNEYPLTRGPLKYDNRPYLRTLLGYQGVYARPWATKALAEIAPDTKLGTSAAFLAVATVPKQALPQVAAALRRFIVDAQVRRVTISDIKPAGSGFSVRDGDRLFELAYALSIAGPQAEPYSEPLIKLLDQKFASPAPPFGLILVEPKALCPVARRIGGRVAAAAKGKPFCNVPVKENGPSAIRPPIQ